LEAVVPRPIPFAYLPIHQADFSITTEYEVHLPTHSTRHLIAKACSCLDHRSRLGRRQPEGGDRNVCSEHRQRVYQSLLCLITEFFGAWVVIAVLAKEDRRKT
jgi:hypothetical protein